MSQVCPHKLQYNVCLMPSFPGGIYFLNQKMFCEYIKKCIFAKTNEH